MIRSRIRMLISTGCMSALFLTAQAEEPPFPTGTGVTMPIGHSNCSMSSAPQTDDVVESGFFSPSSEQIDVLEPALAKMIDDKLSERSFGDFNHRAYIRQYSGLTWKGQQTICVYGLHRDIFHRHGTSETIPFDSPISVMDGGISVFTTAYDLEAGEFIYFHFNGIA